VYLRRGLESIQRYGAIPNGNTDCTAALLAAIQREPPQTSPWGNNRVTGLTTVFFPPGNYHFSQTVTLPRFYALRFVGWGATITCDEDYVFYRDSPVGVEYSCYFNGFTFDSCGVNIGPWSRNTHFLDCGFGNVPDWSIKLSGERFSDWDLEEEGGAGSCVGGSINRCWSYNGNGGIFCQARQSSYWSVTNWRSARMSNCDIKVYSDNWVIGPNIGIEQRKITDLDKPHIHLAGRELADTVIRGVRFGNEVISSFTEPAREAIFIGRLDTAEPMSSPNIRIYDCVGRGRAGGSTTTSANSFIRLNRRVSAANISFNRIQSSYNNFIEFTHNGANDGLGNRLVQNEPGGRPFFNRPPSLLSWTQV
jgi:hypothetical protein